MIKKFILASIIIHAIILSIKVHEKPKSKKAKSKQIVKVKLKKKGEGSGKKEEIFVVKELEKMIAKLQKIAKEEATLKTIMKKCNRYYLGIGVTHNSLFGEITNVAPGGPADRAGIKPGDVPLDGLNIRNKYPEGTQITVSILRKGTTYNIPVTIGKICIEEKRENKKP